MQTEKLKTIQKLGEYFRKYYKDWRIVLVSPNWREEQEEFIREIYHEGGGRILAFARVEVPKSTFFHFHTELQNLGERSIGDYFLFVRDDVIRKPIQVFQTEKGELARRSQFLVEGYPLTITEYFTPEGLACISD